MKTGVIDVGGGMRGIYAAGVLDTCLQQNIEFDYCTQRQGNGAIYSNRNAVPSFTVHYISILSCES